MKTKIESKISSLRNKYTAQFKEQALERADRDGIPGGERFLPRKAVDKYGRDALKSMRQTIRCWHLQLKCDCEITDLSKMLNAVFRDWQGYYGRFCFSPSLDNRDRMS